MKTQIDTQTLVGFLSATGLPAVFHAVISFLHPALYTLTCGQAYIDGAPACYQDLKIEAAIWLILSVAAIAYGVWTYRRWLLSNPTPTETAMVPTATGGTVEIKTVAKETP